jgi:carbonic anhydrase
VLACADSRVPVELIFDAGIGDLFVVRVAGNVADVDETGTLEYGVEHLGHHGDRRARAMASAAR